MLRSFIIVTVLTLAAVARADDRPNVVVVLCDDLGFGDLACYGHPTIETPRLDQLAREGIRLTNCYSAAPVCSPSRAGMLTGRSPSRFGVYDWIPNNNAMHLPADEITVATLLASAGYDTCHVGKWHCNGKFNSDDQPQPGDHGFDHWFSTQNNARPSHANPGNFVRNGTPVGALEGYSCQLVVDEALTWLASREDQAPYFMFVCFHEPHEPVASPPDLVARYGEASRNEALYYANVTNLDAAVGRLVDAIDARGDGESTLLFFTSDNGPETLNRYRGSERSHGSPGPLRGMKLHLHDGGIRVPGILRWTGRVAPGQVIDEPVGGVDVLPTLCSLAGVEVPGDRVIDGADATPVLAGQAIDRRVPLHWTYGRALGEPRMALRDRDWKITMTWTVDGDGFPEIGNRHARRIASASAADVQLYRINDDIGETTDVAEVFSVKAAAAHRFLSELLESLQSSLRDWNAPATPGSTE